MFSIIFASVGSFAVSFYIGPKIDNIASKIITTVLSFFGLLLIAEIPIAAYSNIVGDYSNESQVLYSNIYTSDLSNESVSTNSEFLVNKDGYLIYKPTIVSDNQHNEGKKTWTKITFSNFNESTDCIDCMTNNSDIEVEKDKNTISFTIPLHISFNEDINTLYLFRMSSSEEKTISYSITYKNKLKNKSQIKDSIHFLSKKGATK